MNTATIEPTTAYIYAHCCPATASGATIDQFGLNGSVRRFASEEAYQAELDRIYTGRDGGNLVRITADRAQQIAPGNLLWTPDGTLLDNAEFEDVCIEEGIESGLKLLAPDAHQSGIREWNLFLDCN